MNFSKVQQEDTKTEDVSPTGSRERTVSPLRPVQKAAAGLKKLNFDASDKKGDMDCHSLATPLALNANFRESPQLKELGLTEHDGVENEGVDSFIKDNDLHHSFKSPK